MDIEKNWETIVKVVHGALRTKRFCSVATINEDGSPRLAPIGSLFLGDVGRALYFEVLVKDMRKNLDRDPRICVLAVTGGSWSSLKSLFKGRFDSPPGVRLIGRAGPRRTPTAEEDLRWKNRIKPFRRLKGYNLLWGQPQNFVRDVTFDSFEPLRVGVMGEGLWEGGPGMKKE